MNSTKQEFKTYEFVVYCELLETYSFVVKVKAQNYYWSNELVGVYPFVIHLKYEKEVKHISYEIISDC